MTDDLGQRPTLDNLLDQAASNGWDFFDGPIADKHPNSSARPHVAQDRVERVAAIAAALYTTPEFRELLGFLCETSLHRQTFTTPFVGIDPMQGYAYGVFREGQNSMTFSIFKLIAQGRDQQLKGRDT